MVSDCVENFVEFTVTTMTCSSVSSYRNMTKVAIKGGVSQSGTRSLASKLEEEKIVCTGTILIAKLISALLLFRVSCVVF